MTGRSGTAPDAGLTTAEMVVDMVVVGILMTAMASLVVLAMDTFAPVDETGLPASSAQRELSRSSARMLAVGNCENPFEASTRSACAAVAGAPFPLPREVPARYADTTLYPALADVDVVCWMVEALIGTAAGDTGYRPTGTVPEPGNPLGSYTYLNPDRRDLECWYHDADKGQLLVASHYPESEDFSSTGTAADQDSSDLFEPEWSATAYRVATAADRVELIRGGWRCTPGVDPDPESRIGTTTTSTSSTTTTTTTLPGLDCIPATWDSDPDGVAVLSVDLCVSLSGSELKRRRTAAKIDERLSGAATTTTVSETCDVHRVTVSPGRA